jgi:hypothetical protein
VALERQFPGLTARVVAMRTKGAQVTGCADHGVQQLHPVPEPMDIPADGVQWLHPVTLTGCNRCANGVQPLPERGAAVAPEPSLEPPTEPPAASADARETGPGAAGDRAGAGGGALEFFSRLGPDWPLTDGQRRRLEPLLANALAAGWDPAGLAAFVGANTTGVRSPAAVLAARLSSAELPAPPGSARAWPPWCGENGCNERTRHREGADGADAGRRPRCHPLVAEHAAVAGPVAGSRTGHPPPAARPATPGSEPSPHEGGALGTQLPPALDAAPRAAPCLRATDRAPTLRRPASTRARPHGAHRRRSARTVGPPHSSSHTRRTVAPGNGIQRPGGGTPPVMSGRADSCPPGRSVRRRWLAVQGRSGQIAGCYSSTALTSLARTAWTPSRSDRAAARSLTEFLPCTCSVTSTIGRPDGVLCPEDDRW